MSALERAAADIEATIMTEASAAIGRFSHEGRVRMGPAPLSRDILFNTALLKVPRPGGKRYFSADMSTGAPQQRDFGIPDA